MHVMTEKNADLRLRDLRVLGLVMRERNLTRAAELLDTTQPSISKVLARLRKHFGDPLFTRSGYEMHPTPKVLEIEGPLHGLLVSVDALSISSPSFDARTSERTFKLLVSDVGMIIFLPALTRRLAKEGPRLRAHAVPLGSTHFESKLESGEVDLALGAFDTAAPGLRRQRLYLDGYLGVARRSHPGLPALHTRLGLRSAPHIIVTASDTGHAAHRIVQEAIEAGLAAENVLLRLPSFIAAAIVASQTDGVATIPARLAGAIAEPLGLATFRPSVAMPWVEIAQYWHERYHRDPGHRWLRSIILDLFAKTRRAAGSAT
jgi:DNA-binding transcriptional LysR family regulator